MSDPLVSIIIPTFNRSQLLGDTLDSILSQTYQKWECLVVDDGSNDNTDELMEFYCEKDRRFFYFKRPENLKKGANACRNYGFKKSRGELINWFDSDDLMHPNKLVYQVRPLLESSLYFSVCQTVVFEKDPKNSIALRNQKIFSKTPFEDHIMRKMAWLTQAPLWKRDFLEKSDKLFDEDLQAAQEWEFFARLLVEVKEYHVVDKALVFLRNHTETITHKNYRRTSWNYFLARYKIYSNRTINLNPEVTNYLQNYLLDYFLKVIRHAFLEESFKAYFLYFHREKNIKFMAKVTAVLSIFSYRFFKKGEIFLRHVKY